MVELFLIILAASVIFQVLMFLQAKREAKAIKNFELTMKIIKARDKKYTGGNK